MHEFAKKLIEERIDKLISEWNFEVRKKYHPKECTCYSQDKKCHNIKDLNCLFCLCPHYYLNVEEGGCKINSSKGKFIDTPNGKIWDCSDCYFLHKPENIKKYLLSRIYNL
jgi:Zn-finger protein